MRSLAFAAATARTATLSAVPVAAQPATRPAATAQAPLSLWRLDCGVFTINQYGAFFSDTFEYPPGPKEIVGSCYLIRHGERYFPRAAQ